MELKTPRGTRDFLPEVMIARKHVIQVIEGIFARYGYSPIETPAFEHLETLTCKGGDEVDEQIYAFEDKSGRKLGLRFDLTTPLARLVAQNPNLPMPFKRYHISRVWRYERQQKGRYREFWQADVDVVGSPLMVADAEAVAVAVECLRALGFASFQVRINHRKLLEALAAVCGIPEDLIPVAFRAMDKIDKIGRKGVWEEMEEKGIEFDAIESILDFIEIAGPPDEVLSKAEELVGEHPLGKQGIDELRQIASHLKAFGISDEVVIDLSLVRGLSYYTGPIFEASIPEGGVGSVSGGGRYDGLIGMYGAQPRPAVGISLGIERIMAIMIERKMVPDTRTMARVLVAPVNDTMRSKAIELAQMLRGSGVATDLDLRGRKLGKLFEYADIMGIPYVLVVGPRDLKEGVVVLRNMISGDEERVPLDSLGKAVNDVIQKEDLKA